MFLDSSCLTVQYIVARSKSVNPADVRSGGGNIHRVPPMKRAGVTLPLPAPRSCYGRLGCEGLDLTPTWQGVAIGVSSKESACMEYSEEPFWCGRCIGSPDGLQWLVRKALRWVGHLRIASPRVMIPGERSLYIVICFDASVDLRKLG